MRLFTNGKRTGDVGPRRSPRSTVELGIQTSGDWKTWVDKIRNFCSLDNSDTRVDNRPFIKLIVQGREFKALVDTGAVLSLINDEVADFLTSKGIKPERGQYKLSMADNSRVPVVWTYTVNCEIDRFVRELTVAHLPSLTAPIILGMDIIQPLNLVRFNFNEYPGGEPETGDGCVNSDRCCVSSTTPNSTPDESS